MVSFVFVCAGYRNRTGVKSLENSHFTIKLIPLRQATTKWYQKTSTVATNGRTGPSC